ncbi:Di-copper centre-containing protein [Apiospora saccharicola]
MHFNSFVNCVLAVLCYVGLASSALIRVANSTTEAGCQQPLIRREWRALSIPERQSFIGAVRCLQSKPGQTSDTYAGVKSRYDDFVALHITQTDYVHWVGQLLPHRWHRYFLWGFEQSLRETCGYNGAVPYWDWTKDAVSEQAVLESPIFDPIHGFGGNGPYIVNTTGFPKDWQTMTPDLHVIRLILVLVYPGCIEDGPFAHVNISMGPGNHTEYTPHCLRRDLSPWLVTQTLNDSKLAFVLDAEDFWHLDHRVEGFSFNISDLSVHGGAHLGIGGNIGEMANTYSSPGDPILSKDQLDLADSAFELGVFLFNACRAKSLSPLIESSSGTYSWSYLDQLFDVLRATNEHHKLKLQKLLESLTNREGTSSPTINCDLPLHLLREVYEVTDKSSHTGRITIATAAKQWKVHHRTLAMQAICCFNLAGYLGVGDDFTTAINEFLPPMDKRPSMVDILGFVHPHRPRLNTRMHDEIVQFCNAFLDWTILERGVFRDNPSKLALIQLPILLTEIGYRILETQPRVDQTEHPTIVRFSLCRLLADGDTTQWVPPLLSEVRDSIRTVHHGLGAHENPEDQQDADHREASPLFMQFRYDERSGVYKKDEMQSGNSGKRFPSPNPDPIDPRSCYFKPSKFDPSSNSPTWVYVKSQGQKRNWRLGKVDLKVREKCPDIESRWRDNLGRFQELSEIAGRMEPGCELTYKTTHNHIGEDTQPTVEFCLRFNDDKYCLMACQDRLWVRDPGHVHQRSAIKPNPLNRTRTPESPPPGTKPPPLREQIHNIPPLPRHRQIHRRPQPLILEPRVQPEVAAQHLERRRELAQGASPPVEATAVEAVSVRRRDHVQQRQPLLVVDAVPIRARVPEDGEDGGVRMNDRWPSVNESSEKAAVIVIEHLLQGAKPVQSCPPGRVACVWVSPAFERKKGSFPISPFCFIVVDVIIPLSRGDARGDEQGPLISPPSPDV